MKRPFNLTNPPEAADSGFCFTCSSRTFYTSVLPEEAGIEGSGSSNRAIMVTNLGSCDLTLVLKEGARCFCVEQVARPKKCKLKTWRDCKISHYAIFGVCSSGVGCPSHDLKETMLVEVWSGLWWSWAQHHLLALCHPRYPGALICMVRMVGGVTSAIAASGAQDSHYPRRKDFKRQP